MQTRYLEKAQGSSGKSSFNDGHCAHSAKEDSIDIKKYKPISKNAASRARLNSPEASLNNLFAESLRRPSPPPGREPAADQLLRRAPTEATFRKPHAGHAHLLLQTDALAVTSLRRTAGPGIGEFGGSRQTVLRLKSPGGTGLHRTEPLGRPGSPMATGRLATDSSSSLYRPILLSPKHELAAGEHRPQPSHNPSTSARGFTLEPPQPSSSHRGLSDSLHTDAATQEHFALGTPASPDTKSREPLGAAGPGLQALRRENQELREQVRALETDLSLVLRTNELLLHKLSTFSSSLPEPLEQPMRFAR